MQDGLAGQTAAFGQIAAKRFKGQQEPEEADDVSMCGRSEASASCDMDFSNLQMAAAPSLSSWQSSSPPPPSKRSRTSEPAPWLHKADWQKPGTAPHEALPEEGGAFPEDEEGAPSAEAPELEPFGVRRSRRSASAKGKAKAGPAKPGNASSKSEAAAGTVRSLLSAKQAAFEPKKMWDSSTKPKAVDTMVKQLEKGLGKILGSDDADHLQLVESASSFIDFTKKWVRVMTEVRKGYEWLKEPLKLEDRETLMEIPTSLFAEICMFIAQDALTTKARSGVEEARHKLSALCQCTFRHFQSSAQFCQSGQGNSLGLGLGFGG